MNHDPKWDGHSLSAQRVHSHGRRVRHSSSDSSGSDSSIESSSSSLHSRSSSPEVHTEVYPDTVSPTNVQVHCSSKETDHPSAAQWQLDKWLKKARQKSSSGEQDTSENIPGCLPSPYAQRAPSPARSWDSNQEYSPSRSPISSPQFNYRQSISPHPSPGYSFCPSPFPSTCPSSTPRHSPIPSPVLSVCPSPCGSPRTSHILSPIPRDPPRSPSPTVLSLRARHYPEVQSHQQSAQTTAPHVTKSRARNAQFSNTDGKNKNTNIPEKLDKCRPKSRPTQDKNLNKSKAASVANSSLIHKAKPNFYPSSKHDSETSKSKQTAHFEQLHSSKSNHKSFQHTSQHIPPEAKRLSCETSNKTGHSSHSKPATKISNSKSGEATVPSSAHVLKPSLRKSESKEQGTECVEVQAEGRQPERKKYNIQENKLGKQGKRENRRLAEEQLRRPWIQRSEEDYEKEGQKEQRRTREEAGRGRHHQKADQQHRHEWQTAQVKERLSTTANHPHLQANLHQKDKAKNRRKTEDTSPPLSGTPTLPSPSSSSSTCSSSLETELEYQTPITKVPADSTSHKNPVRRRSQDQSRPDANRLKAAPLRVGIHSEKQQSECRQKLYTLVPFGRGEKASASSQRGLRNLVVQIDLCLLKRVPDSTTSSTAKKPSSSYSSSATKDKPREAMRHVHVPDILNKDGKRKRKLENGVSDRGSKRSIPYANETSGHTNDNQVLNETAHNGSLEEYLDSKSPLSPLSPMTDRPEAIKPDSQTKTSEKNRDKRDVKPKMEVESVKVSRNTQPSTESRGPSGHTGAIIINEISQHAEYYLHEAKRIKHRADAMVDKLGKAVNYIDAALSFMECGKAMEQGPLEAKSPYTMYAETVELIRYAMRLKSHSGPGARQEDRQLAVLCFRCLALLYWQMFRLKKDHALKYSKVLLDYFKTSTKVPSAAPNWNDSGKGTRGLPPSLSPNAKHHGWSSHGGNTSTSFINIPHRIHQMAANHLNITNSVLYSYEYWEVADNLAKENKEFFNYLNTLSGPLTLHSSISHAVQYTRQALQWIRISAKLN